MHTIILHPDIEVSAMNEMGCVTCFEQKWD